MNAGGVHRPCMRCRRPDRRVALQAGSVVVAEYLLQNGAPLDACDLHGRTALHIAAILGNTDLVHLLMHHRASKCDPRLRRASLQR